MTEWKPITFAPYRGAILLCDFDMARVPPEFDKRRQAIVISITSLNHKHAQAPGICTLVPTSSKEPRTIGPEDVLIPAGKYWSFSEDSWVRAKNITTISHSRLSLLHKGGRPASTEFLDATDMARVEIAIKHAMGIP
ncbi:MAG: type II toxin-antitoxin system PemK/MazF family toxin [Candidatus Afipia apatlaquensis]|uniref:Type II toxin-antitoxin system PemK/MazF family toxin n=1 Tax=Candidatus Afipia apatlaquensis TaxID=2712852 RepID=A0A7C9VIX8_9BRAD|nr:type II toxin-antitoxin system PemK/MazF family toxin [Candidatus Afipia apatlaquensis]